MTKPRYPTAVEREAAKRSGSDPKHPADGHRDPLPAQLADKNAEEPKKARLKHLAGSDHDEFNVAVAQAVLEASWFTSNEQRTKLVGSISHALAAIGPRDELEGMLAAQMVAAHNASMECFRRAMVPEQTVEGREMNLSQGNKASRTYAMLLEALNKHRGKGQQKMTVEHVHVYEGGQAIVGSVEGGGGRKENREQSHAKQIVHAPQPVDPMWRTEEVREPVPRAGDEEREMPDARRHQPRRA